MANKEEAVEETVVAAEETTETKKKVTKDPFAKMVEIQIPRSNDGSPNYEIVSVNGRTLKIQKGKKVSVPAPFAEVLENSIKAQEEANNYIEAITDQND